MKTKSELRDSLLSAMRRVTNRNNTPAKMAVVLSAASGVPKEKIVSFINGDDAALTDAQVANLSILS